MENDEFSKKYPALAKDLDRKKRSVPIQSVRLTEEGKTTKAQSPNEENPTRDYAPGRIFSGYDPGPIDFIRRCSTKEEALEIIDYLERKQQITEQYAKELRKQVKEEGLETFGSEKKWGHYEKVNRMSSP